MTTKHQEYIKKYGKGNPKGTPGEGEKTGNDKSPKTPTAGDGMGNTGTGQQPQVRFGKSLVAEGNTSFRKGSPREQLIHDLAHTDLPTILNTDTIDRRNRMLAEVRIAFLRVGQCFMRINVLFGFLIMSYDDCVKNSHFK